MSSTDQAALGGAGIDRFTGRWIGAGAGHLPTIDDFEYSEEIEFAPTPKPFVTYSSRTRGLPDGRPLHMESGYLRPTPGGELELLVSQPTGFVEIHRGTVDSEGTLALTRLTLAASPDAKPVHDVRRVMRVQGDTLSYDLWMAHGDTPLTHHLHATLHRATDR
ncbi:FABP family protein [Rhodococcus erythropolis]|uniref:FABP family protein n=1 Tax=Rhodococcus erythropolis TaxID=1833 RepID=UPI0024B85971|nr:FABP family protein [Rhodococcus erythropolis]MDJ0010875.1 FABP family protein [Rhodococcus erythropolis]